MPRILDDGDVDRLLPPSAALAGVRTAFTLLAAGQVQDEPRRRTHAGTATLNVMSAIAPTLDAIAVKSYPVIRSETNRGSVITLLLYSVETGLLRGVLKADLLGRRRTSAASALATEVMARPDSSTVCLLGTGFQAPAQIDALVEVLPRLHTVLVVGRSADRAAATASVLRQAHPRLHVESGESPTEAVPRADVVVTATGAAEPLFDGGLLRPGTHVNAVGSNHAERRELDRTTFRRTAQVAVDSAAVARLECGDLLANGLDPDIAVEFADVMAGDVTGRTSEDDITVFESHGLALQDLVCAVRVLEAADEAGLGSVADLGAAADVGEWTTVPRHDPERSQRRDA
ncbi:ornithine cyclodeaminase family protein [Prauserella alba]|uniref:Ornithine cyclodeaminase n=1 Tax=Prauserella alba TaxID=176898 RepID=A0ABN1VGJ3_9PSEU|nr:ornithine cyclodeaminase family protein [Prauserella alba]MCP2182893.1 ornithine cyclodeaminase [Prauserella alba]